MRIQQERPEAQQEFAFDPRDGELVVHETVLQGMFPAVEIYHGPSLAIGYHDTENTACERSLLSGRRSIFYVGEQLQSIQVGDQRGGDVLGEDGEHHRQALGGTITAEYRILQGDQLVVQPWYRTGPLTEERLIVSANEPLPSDPHDVTQFNVQGIMTSTGKLITWGLDALNTRQVVDLAIACSLLHTPEEFLTLERQLGHSTLLGNLACADVARLYLARFDEWFDTSFTPVREIRSRHDEFLSSTSGYLWG